MRMPPDHLVVDFANHLGYGEAAFFARDLRMENNLQKKIAHLFREFGIVPAFEGFQNFVGFFDQVGSQRLMRLLAVPGASVQGAQSGLHGHELFKPLAWRQLLRFRRFAAAAAQFFFFFRLLLARRHVLFNYFNFESSVPLYGATVALTSIADLKGTRRSDATWQPVINCKRDKSPRKVPCPTTNRKKHFALSTGALLLPKGNCARKSSRKKSGKPSGSRRRLRTHLPRQQHQWLRHLRPRHRSVPPRSKTSSAWP